MSKLRITSPQGSGPVTVELFSQDGQSRQILLSSAKPSQDVELAPGTYGVQARQLSGAKQQFVVSLEEEMEKDVELGSSFRLPSTDGAEQPFSDSLYWSAKPSEVRRMRPTDAGFGSLRDEARFENNAYEAFDLGATDIRTYTLVRWEFVWTQGWQQVPVDIHPFVTQDTIRLPCPPDAIRALGLLDDTGFGPIVIVPPFHKGIEVGFRVDAVKFPSWDRMCNASGSRAPVAFANPGQTQTRDLLEALSAQYVENAEALWQQSSPLSQDQEEDADAALAFVHAKFRYPYDALLGAHYLLRFCPELLPPAWAMNLPHVATDCSDGAIIAAWMIIQGYCPDLPNKDQAVDHLLSRAFEARITLFARSRFLLGQALQLKPSARIQAAREMGFLRYGGLAGGLDCFWGTDPASPGHSEASTRLKPGHPVFYVNGVFTEELQRQVGGEGTDFLEQ